MKAADSQDVDGQKMDDLQERLKHWMMGTETEVCEARYLLSFFLLPPFLTPVFLGKTD